MNDKLIDLDVGSDEDDDGIAAAPAQAAPEIKKYTNDIQSPVTPIVNRTIMPGVSPAPTTLPVTPAATIPAVSTTPVAPSVPQTVNKPPSGPQPPLPPNPEARKKAMLGCLGAFGSVLLIALVLSFVFLGQSGAGVSPIAKLLGVDQGAFVNGLITFIHLIFISFALIAFVFTMIGLFRSSMAKHDDKEAKKAGLRQSLFSGIALTLILLVWGFAYVYLDSKRTEVAPSLLDPIITTPTETLNISAPIEIKFDATNVPLNKDKYQIVSHDWDFGDKSTGTSQIVSHIYETKGIYDVKLIVNVKDKDTGEISVGGEYHVTVSITNEALSALFEADPQSGDAPLEVNFDASKSSDPDGNIDTYEWDFNSDGDYSDAEGEKVKFTFEKIGKYTVSLRVTNTTGESAVTEKEIEVVEHKGPLAVITIADEPAKYTIGTSYIFKSDGSTSPKGKIQKYAWDFGDGTKTETTKTAAHAFANAGNYDVTLTVTDEAGEDGTEVKKITVGNVKGIPVAKITTDPVVDISTSVLSGKVPLTVVFDASGSTDSDNNIVDYQWDFTGDDKVDGAGSHTSFIYNQEGTYNVTLSVTDSDGNIGKSTIVVKVESQGIVADIKADQVDGTVPLTVNFDASGSTYPKGKIVSYRWDFGDGTPTKLGAAKMNHKYVSIGSYTATVTAIGSDNTQSTATTTITVREIPLNACFSTIFDHGIAPLTTTLDPGCSTGTINNYLWDFGDGGTSTQVKPTHIFENAGTYKVKLEVSDSQNTVSSFELTITVTK